MAFKKYGYYLKGNKIAVIEQSDATSSGKLAVAHCTVDPANNTTKDTCEAAGGQWIPGSSGSTSTYSEYMSPTESVTDGLEIQYAYSPQYAHPSGYAAADRIPLNAWIIQDGYLAFVQDVGTTPASNSTTVGFAWATFAGVTTPTSDTYILVQNSERWNGIHKVQSYLDPTNDGGISSIQTYTKVSKANYGYYTSTPAFDQSDTAIENIPEARFALNDYIWVSGTQAQNRGLFRIDSITAQTTYPGWEDLDGLTKYFRWAGGGASLSYLLDETISTATIHASSGTTTTDTLTDDTDGTMHINQAFLESDSTYLIHDIDILKDETFELDISRYQANAVVYYLKAKLAEDAGDMEKREFFMREFKRQLEKGVSALKRGPYMVQGFKEMR